MRHLTNVLPSGVLNTVVRASPLTNELKQLMVVGMVDKEG
jgi:hypothetical protein